AAVTFVDKTGSEKDETWDYGKLLLLRKQLSPNDVCRLLRELVKDNELKVGDISLEVECNVSRLNYVPSKKDYGYPKVHDWPTEYAEWRIRSDTISLTSEPLVSEALHFYPDGRKAVMDFMKMTGIQQSVFIQIPDYRARMKHLSIAGRKIRLEIESNIDIACLCAKFYGEYLKGPEYRRSYRAAHSPGIDFDGNTVEYEFEEEPDYVSAIIFDRKTGEKIDYREYHYDWPYQEGITVELDQLDIGEIINRGENLNIEFKSNLDRTEDFLETVVSFANTNGGLIIVGVSDKAEIIGFKAKSEEQMTTLISSNIDPLPEFKVQVQSINEIPVTIVEVAEGDNKPYSHRQLGVYVRSGSTDRHATRTDLDQIYEERRQSPYPGI
ncbi:MAG: ATP-binding protein, partial [Candidatus Bathyarchaeota archaeon]|nr:ATP-binding protein [Candidatus Bathyarchaeota archaeon]